MVTAIPLPGAASPIAGPSFKRVGPPPSLPPRATKKQRSDGSDAADRMKRSYFDDRTESSDHYTPSLASPSQILKLEQSDAAAAATPSPTPLKSSLKIQTAGSMSSPSLLDSPSLGDKRGMYSDFVKAALDDRAIGKEGSYQELVSQFRTPAPRSLSPVPSTSILQMLLHSLCGVASRLDKRHHTVLVENILTLPWATMGGDTFARVWMRFVCTLCSVRSEWISEVLSKAVKGLSYRSDWRSLAHAPPSTSANRPTRRTIYSRIHMLLRSLLSLIPTLPTMLAPLILRHFPHKRDSANEHVVYIRNIFEMCEYAEELRPGILDCALGRCVELDVEVQIELEDLEQAEAALEGTALSADLEDGSIPVNAAPADPFDKPIDEDDDSDVEGGSEDGEEDWSEGLDDIQSDDDIDGKESSAQKSSQERITQIRGLVDKLDAIMETLFRQLEATDSRLMRLCTGSEMVEGGMTSARAIHVRNQHFTDLMHIFSRTLLPTFKSRHVQFIVFWFSSLDQDFSDIFLGLLLSKAIYGSSSAADERGSAGSEEVPTIIRVASASYVASLVSRAKYITKRDARAVMINLCAFLDAHLDAYASGFFASQEAAMHRNDSGDAIGPHSLFFAVCQACFYIFCFRWRDLQAGPSQQEDGDGEEASETDEQHPDFLNVSGSSKWCDGLDAIKRAIMSNLNPLANCSATVAEEFAGVAQITGFLYCWSLIERNNRTSKPSVTASPSKASNGAGKASLPSIVRPKTHLQGSATPLNGPSGSNHGSSDTLTPTVTRSELESFFPFDPYRLRASTKWIDPLYREWNDVAPPGMLDDDDDDDDDDDGDEEEEDDAQSVNSSESEKAARTRAPASRRALTIPGARRRPNREGFGAASASSASTNEDQVAQSLNSLEAMSISPYARQ